jgi:hypothetical protein
MKFAALGALFLFAQTSAAAPDFALSVYPVLQKAGCAGCHNADGVASATRLHFPESDATPEAIRAFGLSLAPLVDRATPDNSLLLRKPTKRVPHGGGQRIAPGSADEQTLTAWVHYLATVTPATAATAAEACARPKPALRRLTHAQYNNTVRDLLGDESRLADRFPEEDFVKGFKNQYQSQSISPLQAESYSDAAEKLARSAFRGGDTHGLIPCKPESPTCRNQFIAAFGKKAFRRPLLPAEVDRYARLFATTPTFLAGAQLTVEAMLQSPAFLMRTENGENPQWTPYETASRLSYFLWNTMPDAALMRAAEVGELNTPQGVEAAARRMVNDPRLRQSFDEFLEEWLRFDRLTGSVKDRGRFPLYTPELALAMTEETRRLASDLAWNDRDFMQLFSADYTFLSSPLATLYKLPAPPSEFARVALPAAAGRAGIVGQGTFLGLTSKPEETSPTARGLFVREQFLCQEVPPPPPGVNTNLPANSKNAPRTNQERLAMHLTNETCASCHTLIDPIGFGLEKFDAIGQRRDTLSIRFEPGHGEKGKTETVEVPLKSEGSIVGIADSAFDSPRALGAVLARSPQCQECVVKQLFRYSMGRRETAQDRAVIAKSYAAFRDSGFHLRELLVALVKWESDGGNCY